MLKWECLNKSYNLEKLVLVETRIGDLYKEGAGLSTHFLGTTGMWRKKLGLLYQQEQPSSQSAHAVFHSSCSTVGGTYKLELIG